MSDPLRNVDDPHALSPRKSQRKNACYVMPVTRRSDQKSFHGYSSQKVGSVICPNCGTRGSVWVAPPEFWARTIPSCVLIARGVQAALPEKRLMWRRCPTQRRKGGKALRVFKGFSLLPLRLGEKYFVATCDSNTFRAKPVQALACLFDFESGKPKPGLRKSVNLFNACSIWIFVDEILDGFGSRTFRF